LKQTLPRIVSAGFDEVIVVDYDCPDKTAGWVREFFPSVKTVQIQNEPIFNVSRARNIGAKASNCSWLCFIDADVEISSTYLEWLRRKATPGYFYRREKTLNRHEAEKYKGVYGTVACQSEVFWTIGGFDEVFEGWGMEDDEFYIRLLLSGCKVSPVPLRQFDGAIQHDDELRVAHYTEKLKAESSIVGQLYVSAKLDVMQITDVLSIPMELRQKLYALVRKVAAASNGELPVQAQVPEEISIEIARLGLRRGVKIPKTLILTPRPHRQMAALYNKKHITTKLVSRIKKAMQALSVE
jgi:glycosyltransferase involved in cell wall biosynthesis